GVCGVRGGGGKVGGHGRAVRGYRSELLRWADKVERPANSLAKRHECRAIEAEIQQAIRPLLELRPGRAILARIAQRLFWKSRIDADESHKRGRAITCIYRQICNLSGLEVKRS